MVDADLIPPANWRRRA